MARWLWVSRLSGYLSGRHRVKARARSGLPVLGTHTRIKTRLILPSAHVFSCVPTYHCGSHSEIHCTSPYTIDPIDRGPGCPCSANWVHSQLPSMYRGASLTRKRIPLGPYNRPMPRVLGGSSRGARYPCTIRCPFLEPSIQPWSRFHLKINT